MNLSDSDEIDCFSFTWINIVRRYVSPAKKKRWHNNTSPYCIHTAVKAFSCAWRRKPTLIGITISRGKISTNNNPKIVVVVDPTWFDRYYAISRDELSDQQQPKNVVVPYVRLMTCFDPTKIHQHNAGVYKKKAFSFSQRNTNQSRINNNWLI